MAKQLFLVFTLFLGAHISFAQSSNLVIFSEKGEPFVLLLNGQQVTQTPTLNAKVTDLQAAEYALRIVFNNPSLPAIEQIVAINPDNEVTFGLQRDRQGNSTLRFVNEFSLVYRPIPPGDQQVLRYTGPVGRPGAALIVKSTDPQPVPANSTLDAAVPQATTVSPSTVVDPTSPPAKDPTIPPVVEPISNTVVVVEEVVSTEEVVPQDPLPGYTGPIGCEGPMSPAAFSDAKQSIDGKSFSDSKMRVAKQIARSNCMLTSQVHQIMQLFSFETDKLEFAKFAYDYTYDRGNYYKVNDVFSFENTIKELETYLQGR